MELEIQSPYKLPNMLLSKLNKNKVISLWTDSSIAGIKQARPSYHNLIEFPLSRVAKETYWISGCLFTIECY